MYTVRCSRWRYAHGLQSVNTHKEEEKATTYFFQANVLDKAVAVEEYIFKSKY